MTIMGSRNKNGERARLEVSAWTVKGSECVYFSVKEDGRIVYDATIFTTDIEYANAMVKAIHDANTAFNEHKLKLVVST
jgi:hypothetical protein